MPHVKIMTFFATSLQLEGSPPKLFSFLFFIYLVDVRYLTSKRVSKHTALPGLDVEADFFCKEVDSEHFMFFRPYGLRLY